MMTATALLLRIFPACIPTALLLSSGCAGAQGESPEEYPGQPDAPVSERKSDERTAIHFAIEVTANTPGPIYVLINDEDSQPGWVQAFRGVHRIYLRERCEIEDCANRGVVCGAAMPMVKDIADPERTGLIELTWDGTDSAVNAVSRCETRQPAESEDLIARFCYSREADLRETGDLNLGIPGLLIRPICVERPFTLGDREVVFRL
jgi:hypothetical protein